MKKLISKILIAAFIVIAFPNVSQAASGWVRQNGNWYYYKNDTLYTGWLRDGGWYYLDPETGAMQKGLVVADGTTYITDSNGVLCLNKWISVGGKYYHTDAQGVIIRNSWLKSNKKWYYVGSDGVMKTSEWLKSGSAWYYLDKTGAMKTGWLQEAGYWYYFNEKGIMLRGGNFEINGTTQAFAESGKWVENAVAVYRLYDGKSKHIYTASDSDKQMKIKRGWKEEGIAWFVSTNKSNPMLYALYNNTLNQYYFTTSPSESTQFSWNGYSNINPNPAWHSLDEATGLPVYKLYNKNAGTYHFTKDSGEKNNLVKAGWSDEGIAFYAIKDN